MHAYITKDPLTHRGFYTNEIIFVGEFNTIQEAYDQLRSLFYYCDFKDDKIHGVYKIISRELQAFLNECPSVEA